MGDHDHWHDRWNEGRTGFHQGETINAHLQRHWGSLAVDPGAPVLVPLCGKTTDLIYLRSLGHEVVGVELSPIACEAFFEENALAHTREGERFVGDGITLVCGDYFAPRDLPAFGAVYDRAALIAIPPSWRERYIATTRRLAAPGAPMLLLTLEYPSKDKSGPPFSIAPDLVRELYGSERVELLEQEDRSDQEGVKWGLEYLHQYAMRVIC
ncbi:MAG: thiopurine S-methyltransferase [Proteobacteria bacterium]|nr:thiopurine S-methyltransferase [Pseudomonadota bacterium]